MEEILKYWPGVWVDKGDPQILHEAKLLNLSIDKAYHVLQWKPTLDFQQAIQYTVSWYRNSVSVAEYTKKQISSYTRQAHDQMIAWAK